MEGGVVCGTSRGGRWANFWGKTFLLLVPVKAGIPSRIGGRDKPFLGREPGPDRFGKGRGKRPSPMF
jgi:hypothetical protein